MKIWTLIRYLFYDWRTNILARPVASEDIEKGRGGGAVGITETTQSSELMTVHIFTITFVCFHYIHIYVHTYIACIHSMQELNSCQCLSPSKFTAVFTYAYDINVYHMSEFSCLHPPYAPQFACGHDNHKEKLNKMCIECQDSQG